MTTYTTPESAGQVELCAVLTGATLTTDLSPVNIRTVDGTAEAEGMGWRGRANFLEVIFINFQGLDKG